MSPPGHWGDQRSATCAQRSSEKVAVLSMHRIDSEVARYLACDARIPESFPATKSMPIRIAIPDLECDDVKAFAN
jgi:hypothetical protein